jgi:hypothetical protein
MMIGIAETYRQNSTVGAQYRLATTSHAFDEEGAKPGASAF